MIYVFLADGFEEIEAVAPIDILKRAGADVITVGIDKNDITAAHGVKFITDTTDDKIQLSDELELIVLPGGMPGADNLENCPQVQKAIDYCAANDKYIAAICAAPKIIGHKGLLDGKTATCFPGFEKDLHGAKLSSELTVADGKFVTAKGAGAAIKFGLKLVEKLYGEAKAQQLEASMQCK